MLEININKGKVFKIPTEPQEFSIKQFEEISEILNNETILEFDRYYKVFSLLGIDEDILDSMDTENFINLIKEYNEENVLFTQDNYSGFTRELVFSDGYTYTSFGDKFFITVKDMKYIEEFIKENQFKFVGELLAVLFKRNDLTKNEHYTKAHIKHKAKLIREDFTMDIALPFIFYFSDKLVSQLQAYKNSQLENIENQSKPIDNFYDGEDELDLPESYGYEDN
jgi:hypothetical protein